MKNGLSRVAVTGLGALCGLGQNVNDIWSRAIKGENGISILETVDTSQLSVKIGGEVKNFSISEDLLSYKEKPRFDRFIHFALHAIDEALKDAKLDKESGPYIPERKGCILGVGIGGFPMIEDTHKTFLEKGQRRVGPFFIPGIIPNMTAGLVSIKFGLKGSNFSCASACASGLHAISNAFNEIALGRQDVIVTGGAEAVIGNLAISGFTSMKALSRNQDPETASRPFDKKRDGFVIGEGAGILILENYEKAKARGAKIYAELMSVASSSDAFHITSPSPDGSGAAYCMNQALELAGITPDQIGYINAHATSTPAGDIAENNAIEKIFAQSHSHLCVSSTKSMTGHLLGAAGGLESVFCIKSLETGIIPPTRNLEDLEEGLNFNYVPQKAINKGIEYALNNSFGFGGTNSCAVFKKA